MLRPNPESTFPGAVPMARYVAEMIPDTQLVELPAEAGIFAFLGDTDTVLATIERFLTGRHAERPADRVLGTVLFTDLVDSTGHAARDGDRRWRDRLDAHDTMVRACLQRHRGREINTTGDGFLAMFDGPARAISCAQTIIDGTATLGLATRAGVHTGV
jgi:class 3 adenylate cyclase